MIKNNICMKKKERNQLQPSMCNHPWSCLTCPQEEHFIAPINSIHLIHHQGSVPIVHTSSHHQGAAMDRINWMKHEGMGSDEIHSLIWKVLWGSDTRSEGSSRTLGGKKKEGRFRVHHLVTSFWFKFQHLGFIPLCHFGHYVTETYRSRPWVGNLASVLCPLIIMAMFVGKRSVEYVADISHRVNTDCWSLEHRAWAQTDN